MSTQTTFYKKALQLQFICSTSVTRSILSSLSGLSINPPFPPFTSIVQVGGFSVLVTNHSIHSLASYIFSEHERHLLYFSFCSADLLSIKYIITCLNPATLPFFCSLLTFICIDCTFASQALNSFLFIGTYLSLMSVFRSHIRMHTN